MFFPGCPGQYSVFKLDFINKLHHHRINKQYFKILNSKRVILFCSYLVVLAQELGVAVLAVVERPEGKNTILKS